MDVDQNPAVEAKELTLEQSLRSQINNPELSDCVFLVGEQRTRIYAHKYMLAMNNPVFKSMFFGELKETKFEVEIPDLHEKGFLNLISYLYTKQVPNFDLSEIYWTVTAANKYLAFEFIKRFLKAVEDDLGGCTSCLIYEQLLKLELDDESLIKVAESLIKAAKSIIQISPELVFDGLTEIDQQTLKSILRFDQLYADESTLLCQCLEWTNAELKRRNLEATAENKRSIFVNFKHLIRFSDLKTSDLARMNIDDYLPSNEAFSVLLHSADKSKPLVIDYRSPRVPFKCLTAEIGRSNAGLIPKNSVFQSECKLRVNKKVFLGEIETQPISIDCHSVVCEIFKDNNSLGEWECYYSVARSFVTLWSDACVDELSLELQPDSEYTFCFRSSTPLKEPGTLFYGQELTARSEDGEFTFTLNDRHFIAKIEFYPVLLHNVPLN